MGQRIDKHHDQRWHFDSQLDRRHEGHYLYWWQNEQRVSRQRTQANNPTAAKKEATRDLVTKNQARSGHPSRHDYRWLGCVRHWRSLEVYLFFDVKNILGDPQYIHCFYCTFSHSCEHFNHTSPQRRVWPRILWVQKGRFEYCWWQEMVWICWGQYMRSMPTWELRKLLEESGWEVWLLRTWTLHAWRGILCLVRVSLRRMLRVRE